MRPRAHRQRLARVRRRRQRRRGLAAAFGVLVIWLNTNQYATGLALSLFGAGFSASPASATRRRLPERSHFDIPLLSTAPGGPACFRQHPLVYLASVILALALSWFLIRSRAGLVLRAVGESPESAHALGYAVRPIRMAAVMLGGALCGMAGAYISLVYTPLWVEGMVAGKGWIALALTTFATWRPAACCWAPTCSAASPCCSSNCRAGRADSQPVPDDAAVPGDNPGAGADLAQSDVDPHQHARFAWETLPSRRLSRHDRCSRFPSFSLPSLVTPKQFPTWR
jgi:hypothetical protein